MIECAPRSEELFRYEEAVLYCQFCNHNGHNDWRMPTNHEWNTTIGLMGWYVESIAHQPHYVTPVRDV